ncbi:MAG: twin-arginine translocation signal domain-containing protein, partial [Acidobacteriaceae bacterium]
MDRRSFLKTAAIAGIAGGVGSPVARAYVPAHNWGHYDFGSGPHITDRLNQGPFPQYPPEAISPGGDVVMATTPTNDIVPNYGKGLVTYIAGDLGRAEIKSNDLEQAIEALAALPLG